LEPEVYRELKGPFHCVFLGGGFDFAVGEMVRTERQRIVFNHPQDVLSAFCPVSLFAGHVWHEHLW
jgi:hypothetical protein